MLFNGKAAWDLKPAASPAASSCRQGMIRLTSAVKTHGLKENILRSRLAGADFKPFFSC
jgi:hypothetical protein